MDLPNRKPARLSWYDYSTPGAYFITICTKNRKNILGSIVGGGAFDAPRIQLSDIGQIVCKHLLAGDNIPYVHLDKYVIMPNHLHFILMVDAPAFGVSKSPSPANAVVPHFVSVFKRFCHQSIGQKIFQRSYHDHVIRGEKDYRKIWEYIENNPSQWEDDCFYTNETCTD